MKILLKGYRNESEQEPVIAADSDDLVEVQVEDSKILMNGIVLTIDGQSLHVNAQSLRRAIEALR